MKQVTVTLTFVISDSKLDLSKDIHHTSLNYLETQGTRVNKHVECQQLYNVKVFGDQFVKMRRAGLRNESTACNKNGLLTFCKEVINYTKGQAIKKARVFEGKVVKCVD